MLLLLHSAFMLSVVEMLLRGEVGGSALISQGNYIVDHGKIMELCFLISVGTLNYWYNKYGLLVKISKKMMIKFLSLKIYFILANSADPDEMPQGGISTGSSLFANSYVK